MLSEWQPRQRKFSIGRIFFVSLGCGEMYYLRSILNIVRGPTNNDEMKTVNGIRHNSFRDTCYALGLLDDDKEYIDGIVEASHWAFADSLRRIFTTLLLSESFSRPENVWEKCLEYLSDDILYMRRNVLQHQGIILITKWFL